MGILLNSGQIRAVYEGERWNKSAVEQVIEISGAAGTGKTFLARYLIERFGLDIDEVLFVAYMGKAALQLSLTGLPARTIHSVFYDYMKVLDKDDAGNIQFLPSGKPKTKWEFVKKERLSKKIKMILIDEGGMVPENMARDIISFGLPIMVLGDLNQLPPVFGKPYFLQYPRIILDQIMRQAEDNPIIYIAHKILEKGDIDYGVYGSSIVLRKNELNDLNFKNADIVLTGTNKLRYEINTLFREHLLDDIRPDRLNIGEKIICRKNNWGKSINDNIFLTNGLSGYADYTDYTRCDGKKLKIDFRPEFTKKSFKNLTIDLETLFANPKDEKNDNPFDFTMDKFEFANAITTHLSQGSQWDDVLFLKEKMSFMTHETYKKLLYTAVTRAKQRITIAA